MAFRLATGSPLTADLLFKPISRRPKQNRVVQCAIDPDIMRREFAPRQFLIEQFGLEQHFCDAANQQSLFDCEAGATTPRELALDRP